MKESWLIRIDCDPPARIASTANNRRIPADYVEDEDGALYLGGSNLLNVPNLQALINDVADRIEIGVSGVSPEIIALAQSEAALVKNKDVHIGRINFDDGWQRTSVEWVRTYRVDKLTVTRQTQRTISLSLGSDNTGRAGAPNAFFTALDQRRRSPTDTFLDNIAGMSEQVSRKFGLKD